MPVRYIESAAILYAFLAESAAAVIISNWVSVTWF
jgi:hypothetical protein